MLCLKLAEAAADHKRTRFGREQGFAGRVAIGANDRFARLPLLERSRDCALNLSDSSGQLFGRLPDAGAVAALRNEIGIVALDLDETSCVSIGAQI